jgi:hypothetical protein
LISAGVGGLDKDSRVMLDQIRSLDKKRLLKQIGVIDQGRGSLKYFLDMYIIFTIIKAYEIRLFPILPNNSKPISRMKKGQQWYPLPGLLFQSVVTESSPMVFLVLKETHPTIIL